MAEIEKARKDVDNGAESLLCAADVDISGPTSRYSLTTAVEALIDEKLAEHANRFREIAREEIEAAKGYKPQPGDRVFDVPSVTPAPKVDAGTGVSAVTTPATGASGFAIPGDSFNQEGGDPHSSHREAAMGQAEDKSPPAVEAPAAGDEVAKRAYVEMTDNHPTMHSNRFPSWEELDEAERQKWRDKVQPPDMTALARRLAAMLKKANGILDNYSTIEGTGLDICEEINTALAEARKHKLIE